MPLKFLAACFYRTFSRPWCLLKKIVAINLENHWVDNFCLKFLYLDLFCLCTSVFRMLLWWISSETIAFYTSSCLLNLPFLVSFCSFWKVKSLLVVNLFISEHLGKILPWMEMELALSLKLQTEYLFAYNKN